MIILGILQNMWVKDPERVKRMIERDGEEFRRRLIEFALFAGCKTGRVLKRAFGEQLCQEIIWEEASRVVSGHAAAAPPADVDHLKAVIAEIKPDYVIGFGVIAQAGIELTKAVHADRFVRAPHPASRDPNVNAHLTRIGKFIVSKLGTETF